MALKITPGPIPKDGVAYQNVEDELKAFVQRTEILNLGIQNFTNDNTPFVVSQTEPPSFRTPGQLWFKRGEGRMYCWFTQGVSSESWGVLSGSTVVNSAYPMVSSHWICVSDRKEIYAQYYSSPFNSTLLPYQPVRLEAGHLSDTQGAYNDDTIDWALGLNRDVPYQATAGSGLWGSSKAYVGPRLGGWEGRPYSSKFFVHTTNQTIPHRVQFAGVFHELGFRRVASYSLTGPAYAGLEGVNLSGQSDLDDLKLGQLKDKSLHIPVNGVPNPYNWDYGTNAAFVGYVTESGPQKTPNTMLTFWFASCPRNMFTPS